MSLGDDLAGKVRERLRIPADWRERLKPHAPDGLSSRLLLLTVAFTLAVEALIIAPSAASFHERWLTDRLQAAELASVGVEALPYNAVDDNTAESMLRIGGVSAVAISDQGVMRQLLQAHRPTLILETGSDELVASLVAMGYRAERLPGSPNVLLTAAG